MHTFPCAKLNIGLNIVSRRDDGYHNLESVFYPIPLCDTLEIEEWEPADDPCQFRQIGFHVDADPSDNLVVKAFELMREEFGLPAIDIFLDKRIPMGAGLGGGSSDAAAMVSMLNEMFELNLSEAEMATRVSQLGADCAFFIYGKPQWVTGIGTQMAPIPFSLKGWKLLLVKPAVSVATAEAYRHVVPRRPITDLREDVLLPVDSWRGRIKNDFEDSVFKQFPEIEAIKKTLYDMGATYASMSGSGSSVFGLFPYDVPETHCFDDCFTYKAELLI